MTNISIFVGQHTIHSQTNIYQYIYQYQHKQRGSVVDGVEGEMYKTNFIQRLWQECIDIIKDIKVNKIIL